MKTKNAILVGAVVLLSAGALSNLQWSMNKYGLLSSSLSKHVLALSDSDTSDGKDGNGDDTGINERRYKEKKYQGEKQTITTTTTTTTSVGANLGVVKGEKSTVKTETKTSYLYLNECVGEGDLKNCVSSWDEMPMR